MTLIDSPQSSRLRAGALSAIWRSHAETFHIPRIGKKRVHGQPPEEDFVALLIVHGLRLLMNAWRPFFNKWKLQLSLSGVFCHQTPKAEFIIGAQTVAPELADLLIVRRHTDIGGRVRQVACLVQAKMSKDGDVTLPQGDPQLHLLTQWPSFRAKGKNTPNKNFAVGRAERQSVYAAILRHFQYPEDNLTWPDSCVWGTLLPTQKGSVEKSLASFFIDLLNFDEGREFYDPDVTACDRSELVYYLLNTTFSMPLRTRDLAFPMRGASVDLNRTAFAAKEDLLSPGFLIAKFAPLIDGSDAEPPPQRVEADFAEGGQGRVIILETSEMQG
jgi:hypothetical protein